MCDENIFMNVARQPHL